MNNTISFISVIILAPPVISAQFKLFINTIRFIFVIPLTKKGIYPCILMQKKEQKRHSESIGMSFWNVF